MIVCALFLAAVPGARAQEGAQLRVKVVDQTGGSLPQATLVLEGPGATSATLTPTDTMGVYSIGALAPGRYTLTVQAEGFGPAKKTVDIRANRVNEATVVLTVHTSEKVEVSGLSNAIPNSLTSMTLTRRDLALLPNDDVLLLNRLQELAGSRGRPGDLAIYVDGFRDFRRLPPKSAIELIQINAEPYSAQFPEPGTRRIEIVTKPGGDGVFGEVKTDFNDESLNAREPLATSKPALQRRTVSGYLSAPVVPQKWGFYVYAGRWEQDENAIVHATTLNDALLPTPFQQTLSSPLRLNNVTGNSGFALGKNVRLKAEYSRDETTAGNQGLTGGFDLPERGFTSDVTTTAGRFSLLSVIGQSTVYEMRVQMKGESSQLRGLTSDTAILVLNAFNGGANQSALYKDTATNSVQTDAKLTRALGAHTLKFGLQADHFDISDINYANFGGTFVFGADVERDRNGAPVVSSNGATIPVSPIEVYRRTLLGLTGYGPTLFTITTGDPLARARQWQFAGYVQDDWTRTKSFTLSSGLRYEAQTDLGDRLDLAPRVGIAWQLGEHGGVVRGGGGIFYKRFEPTLALNAARLDGHHVQEFVVPNPTFNPPPPLNQSVDRQTIVAMADDLKAGRLMASNVGYERTLFGPLFGSVTYTFERGDHLTRSTDINAPVAIGGVRPITGIGQVLEYQSTARSRRQDLQLGLRAGLGKSQLVVNYTLASAKADADDPQTLPADSHNIANEWGPAATDERHRAYVSGTIMFPRFYMLIPSFTYGTPRPFNITTGLDNNLDGHVTDRPSFATAADLNAVATPFGLLNPFPTAGETIIPRNFGQGSRTMKFDLAFAKVFIIADPRERRTLSFSVTAQNLLNTINLRDYNGVLLSPLFNQANTADLARRVSVGLGFSF